MELRHLRYFTSIVEHKGYREASRHLHIAQPALTQTVHDLEDELGSQLFLRQRSKLTLTPAGKAFYDAAKRTLDEAGRAVVAARHASKGLTGSLAIGFIPGAAQHFLPHLITVFRQQHPGIELDVRELTPSVQIEQLLRSELDIGFTRELTTGERKRLTSRWLFQVPLMAVLPASRVSKEETIDMASLVEDHFILLDREQSPSLFDSIVDLCRSLGFTPKIASHAHLAESMFTLVEAGEGVSIVPAWARVLAPRHLNCYLIKPNTVQVELVAAWGSTSPSVALQFFLAVLDTEAANISISTEREYGGTAFAKQP